MNSSQTLSKISDVVGADMVMSSMIGEGKQGEEVVEPEVEVVTDRVLTFVVVSLLNTNSTINADAMEHHRQPPHGHC